MFNIGAAGQWIGGALVATWLGYAVNLPIVLHAVVCIIGAFAGGAVIGWIVGEIKARTGAHEVILTIMLNYVMYNFLAFVLSSQSLMQAPGQTNAVAPNITGSATLPHVGGPPPQVGVGFLVAVAAAAGTAWLLSRSTLGFEFRAVGASPSAARSAGIRVERVWVLSFLIAGGLAGLSASTIVQGQTAPLTTTSYGTYGFDGITVALLGRARPLGVVLAGLLFGALNAGGTVMEAATGVPSDVTNVIEALIVLFVAAPPLIRLLFRLRSTSTGPQAVTSKGWSG
jgi:simple sugar transport system permease protein